MSARDGWLRLLQAAEAVAGPLRYGRGDNARGVGVCHGATSTGALSLRHDPMRGKAQVKCFAGCDRDAVLDLLGIDRAALWDEPLEGVTSRAHRPFRAPAPRAEPRVLDPAPFGWTPSHDTWMPPWCGHTKIAEYTYTDESGRIVFGVARCSSKDFAQWRPTPDNRHGRKWSLCEYAEDTKTVIGTVRRVPFRLPQLIAAIREQRSVYVVEGEKDALAVVDAGGDATTIKGAGGGWWPEYSAFFAGANVIVVPDRDVPGRRHAELLVRELVPVAASVSVALAVSGKDPHDHLAAGFTLDDFQTIWTPSRAETAE